MQRPSRSVLRSLVLLLGDVLALEQRHLVLAVRVPQVYDGAVAEGDVDVRLVVLLQAVDSMTPRIGTLGVEGLAALRALDVLVLLLLAGGGQDDLQEDDVAVAHQQLTEVAGVGTTPPMVSVARLMMRSMSRT